MIRPRLPLLAVLATLVAAASAVAAKADPLCPTGPYRSANGHDILYISPPPDPDEPPGPQRYTRLDGEQGALGAADGKVSCPGGLVKTGDGVSWTKIAFRETPTTFTTPGGVRLNGLLMEPLGVHGKPPLILFSHGSEHYSPLRLYYQSMFAAQGISTFFYDKRGTGGSGGAYSQNFNDLSDDAAAAATEARRLAAGRFSRLGYFGGSQGGWVAPAAALKAHADFVEVAFGVVGTPVEQDQWQVDYQLKAAGFPDSILPKVHEVTDATARIARSQFTAHFEELEQLRQKYGREPWFDRIDGQYSGELLRHKLDFTAYKAANVPWDYRSEDVLRQLKIPQLWVVGAEDSVAPSAHTVERLEALRKAGADIRIVVYPNADHGIRLFRTNSRGEHETYRMADGYLRLIADWAAGRSSPPYGDAIEPK